MFLYFSFTFLYLLIHHITHSSVYSLVNIFVECLPLLPSSLSSLTPPFCFFNRSPGNKRSRLIGRPTAARVVSGDDFSKIIQVLCMNAVEFKWIRWFLFLKEETWIKKTVNVRFNKMINNK